MTLTSSFEIGVNQDLAAVDVQNRLAIAQPRLPQDVVRTGLPITKTSSNIVCVVFITSPTKQFDDVYLANYATINVIDRLKRIPGVGDCSVFGAKVLALEPRHFGALSGLALCDQQLGKDADALQAMRRTAAVFPEMPGLKKRIKELTSKVEGEPT